MDLRKTRELVTRVYEVAGMPFFQVQSAALFTPGVLEVHFVDGVFTHATLRASAADKGPGGLWAGGLRVGDLPEWAKPVVRYEEDG